MPILHFKGFPHTDTYNGPSVSVKAGDKVEVSKEKADYLLETFGSVFEAVGSAVAAPKKSRAVKSPTKRAAPKPSEK